MKNKSFLEDLAINLSNIKQTLYNETLLFEFNNKELVSFLDLKRDSKDFDSYFINKNISISLYSENNRNYLFINDIKDNSFHIDKTVIIPFFSLLQRIPNNIF
jgi:hypothetical protein